MPDLFGRREVEGGAERWVVRLGLVGAVDEGEGRLGSSGARAMSRGRPCGWCRIGGVDRLRLECCGGVDAVGAWRAVEIARRCCLAVMRVCHIAIARRRRCRNRCRCQDQRRRTNRRGCHCHLGARCLRGCWRGWVPRGLHRRRPGDRDRPVLLRRAVSVGPLGLPVARRRSALRRAAADQVGATA